MTKKYQTPTNSEYQTPTKVWVQSDVPKFGTEVREGLLESGGYVHPIYPRKAKMLGQEGSLEMRLDVRDGRLFNHELIKSSGFPLLDGAALEAIRKWQFKDVTLVYIQKVRFRLDS